MEIITMDDKALNIVIEKLSEICNQTQNTDSIEETVCQVPDVRSLSGDSATNQVNIIGLNDNNQAIYRCKDCGYTSHNKYYLRQHLDLVHNSKRPYKCPFCDYAGKRSYALKEHLIVHSSDRPHECVHCHATFRKKGHLSNHLKMHASQLVCSLCHVTCKGKQQLLTHLHQQHSSPGIQVYACDQCLFASNDNNEMMRHLKEHTEPKQNVWLKCSVCGYSCSTQSLMRTHMFQNHLNQESVAKQNVYSCNSCGFKCSDKAAMTDHISDHLCQNNKGIESESKSDSSGRFTYNPESRTFACAICNYTCDQQRTIKSHIWKHSGHKDILYPMFQNGPLSLSEGKYLPKTGNADVIDVGVHSGGKGDDLTLVCEVAENVCADFIEVETGDEEITSEAEVEVQSEMGAGEDGTAEQEQTECLSHKSVMDIAQQAALIAQIVSVEMGTESSGIPPIDVVINSGSGHSGRKRRASDSILEAKRARMDQAESGDETAERVVVIQNENADDEPQLSAMEEHETAVDEPDSACIVEEEVIAKETMTVPTRMLTRQSKRSGICSSLLAVIEQLRENPGSEELTVKSSETEQQKRPALKRQSTAGEKTKESSQKENDSWGWDKNNLERLSDGHYRCRLCHYQSLQFLLIAQHMKLHKIKQPFECSLCEHVAENSLSLQEHMLQHCKIRTYQCKTCSATFNYKSQLRAHCRIHEKEPFSCSSCDFESVSPLAFRNHLRVHAESEEQVRAAQVVVVAETEEDKNAAGCVKEPEVENTVTTPLFGCKACDFTSVRSDLVHSHMELVHKSVVQPEPKTVTVVVEEPAKNELQCTQCEFKAISVRSLKSHMKRHINDQRYVEQPLEQYKCTLCGYVCHHLPSLKSHMWRHASDTTYSYSRANDVINAAIDRDSSKSATGNEIETFVTFRCIVCGFESTDRGKLAVHMRQHQDVIDKTLEI